MALIIEYPPGAPIGWHRDALPYDIVAGISLLSACRMRFRPDAAALAIARLAWSAVLLARTSLPAGRSVT